MTLGLGVLWFLVSQVFAFRVRGRLGRQDQSKKLEQLAKQEVASLGHAQELFASQHYDLSVIEVWRAVESRLRRALLNRGIVSTKASPDAVINAAIHARILRDSAAGLIHDLKRQWDIAIGNEPLGREGAETALSAARLILPTIPLPDLVQNTGLAGNVVAEK